MEAVVTMIDTVISASPAIGKVKALAYHGARRTPRRRMSPTYEEQGPQYISVPGTCSWRPPGIPGERPGALNAASRHPRSAITRALGERGQLIVQTQTESRGPFAPLTQRWEKSSAKRIEPVMTDRAVPARACVALEGQRVHHGLGMFYAEDAVRLARWSRSGSTRTPVTNAALRNLIRLRKPVI